MSRLVFIDTETTSLRPDRRAWDIGLIVRDTNLEVELQWFIDVNELDLGNADPFALKVGRFYDRHPQMIDSRSSVTLEYAALRQIERETRGAHLVGAVPNFDAEVLATRMRAHGIAPSWHYHLIDVEALAVGALAARGQWPGPGINELDALPWSSDALSTALGVTVSDEDRHTALGDARWARALYDAATRPEGGAPC